MLVTMKWPPHKANLKIPNPLDHPEPKGSIAGAEVYSCSPTHEIEIQPEQANDFRRGELWGRSRAASDCIMGLFFKKISGP